MIDSEPKRGPAEHAAHPLRRPERTSVNPFAPFVLACSRTPPPARQSLTARQRGGVMADTYWHHVGRDCAICVQRLGSRAWRVTPRGYFAPRPRGERGWAVGLSRIVEADTPVEALEIYRRVLAARRLPDLLREARRTRTRARAKGWS